MPKRDLTPAKIITTYLTLADELGLEKVTFPRLAERLNIKPPSLYNHFKNLRDLQIQTAIQLHTQLNDTLTQALVGQAGAQALLTYANTYRQFALANRAGYPLLNMIPSFQNQALSDAGRKNNQILVKLLAGFNLSPTDQLIANRGMRSLLHGYLNLSQLGYFQHTDLSDAASFELVVQKFIAGLH